MPCSASAISGMTLCRKAPLALTTLLTSLRCSSLTPGISTELTFTRMPRATSISRPFCWRSMRIFAAFTPRMRLLFQ
ncbi:hypothetical protein D3C81_1577160 [compost metagenome]